MRHGGDAAGESDDDGSSVTLRLPRSFVAACAAALAHLVVLFVISQLPDPTPPPKRISVTIQKKPPPPPPEEAMSPKKPTPPPKTSPKKKATEAAPPPSTSPVLPELPPSENPPENRAQLPVAEKSDTPAPPPKPSSWRDHLLSSLAETTPQAPTGVLAPSFSNLASVANNDSRLHDDENEARLQENFGPFFRRGIEALRSQWHPDDALRMANPEDPTRLCGRSLRTTRAIAIINKAGKVIDVELKESSGCLALDNEAVSAFKRVGNFPHPPSGLFVLPDGSPAETARMPVRFIVSFNGGFRLDWQ